MHRMRMIWSLPRLLMALAVVAAIAGAITFQPGRSAAQDSASITIENFAFTPASVTVTAGATVTWTNNDSAPHTATGDGGEFDTGNIAQGGIGQRHVRYPRHLHIPLLDSPQHDCHNHR